jgi:hypothetical protein
MGKVAGSVATVGLGSAVVFNLEKITPFMREFGLAVVVVLFVGAALWRVIAWVGRRGDEVIGAHRDYLHSNTHQTEQLVHQTGKQTEILATLVASQGTLAQQHEKTHHIIEAIHEAVRGCPNQGQRKEHA